MMRENTTRAIELLNDPPSDEIFAAVGSAWAQAFEKGQQNDLIELKNALEKTRARIQAGRANIKNPFEGVINTSNGVLDGLIFGSTRYKTLQRGAQVLTVNRSIDRNVLSIVAERNGALFLDMAQKNFHGALRDEAIWQKLYRHQPPSLVFDFSLIIPKLEWGVWHARDIAREKRLLYFQRCHHFGIGQKTDEFLNRTFDVFERLHQTDAPMFSELMKNLREQAKHAGRAYGSDEVKNLHLRWIETYESLTQKRAIEAALGEVIEEKGLGVKRKM